MSSADKQEHGSLEEQFRSRMHDAEALPAPDLWARIDHELTLGENKSYKERFVLYRQLAAACFVLFMLAGAMLSYQLTNQATEPAQVAVQQEATSSKRNIAAASAAEPTDFATATQPQSQAPAASGTIASTQRARAGASREATAKRSELSGIVATRGGQKAEPQVPAALQATEQRAGSIAEASFATTGGAESATDSQKNITLPAIAELPHTKPDRVQSVVVRQKQPVEEKGILLPINPKAEDEPQYKTLAAADMLKNDEKQDALQKSLDKTLEKEKVYASASDSRWSVGMASGPSYFNQNIGLPDQMMPAVNNKSFAAAGPRTSDFAANNMEAAREEYDENTDAAFSYGMEMRAGFRLGRNLKLLAGLGYIQNSARTKTSYIFKQYWYKPTTQEPYELISTIFMPSLTSGFSPDSISVEKTDPFYVNYQYKQITVPIGLQYEGKIGNRGWLWYASGALAANFLTESQITTTSDEVPSFNYNNQKEESPFRKVQFSSNLGMGIGRKLSESVLVVVGPEFRTYLSSMLANPDQALAPQGKPYSVGVNLGVQYMLGK